MAAQKSEWANALCEELKGTADIVNPIKRLDRASASSSLRDAASTPIVVTDALGKWPALKSWSVESLACRFGNSRVRVGLKPGGAPQTVLLRDFHAYLERDSDGDLDPQYVFEPQLRAPLTDEYDSTVAGLFPDDHMSILGEATRPPHRWLCLGPRRSGSRPHIDPLATSAWNALLLGKKRWVLLDPQAVGALAPLSLVQAGELSPAEWFKQRLPILRSRCKGHLREVVQEAGELMYVPAGFWHAVLNLTDTVAVTHNFVGKAEFDASWRAMRSERPGLASEWLQALSRHEPSLAARARTLGGDPSAGTQLDIDAKQASLKQAGPASDFLRQRLLGKRHMVIASDGSQQSGPKPASWSEAARLGHNGKWLAVQRHARGDLVFIGSALACAYGDEDPNIPLRSQLLKKLPRTSETKSLFSLWGLGADSSQGVVSKAIDDASQLVWCLPAGEGSARIEGLALFPFSGLLRHSADPTLALMYICDTCVGVAAREIEVGDELSICAAPWRFDDQAYAADLRDVAAKLVYSNPRPAALPDRDNAQMVMIQNFLSKAERATWGGTEEAQQEAAEKVKSWLQEFSGVRLLKAYPYLNLRVHALATHLFMGTQLLDDAWDAAVIMSNLLSHAPLSEAAELCVCLAVLGGALAYQQRQASRACQLFVAAEHLLAEALGGDSDVWEPWLRTFVPSPLLEAALAAWDDGKLTEAEAQLPALGTISEDTRGCLDPDFHGTNESQWIAGMGSIAQVEEFQGSGPRVALETLCSESPTVDVQNESSSANINIACGEAMEKSFQTALGRVDVDHCLGIIKVSLIVDESIAPDSIDVSVDVCSVRFSSADSLEVVEVPLPETVDISSAAPAKFSKKRRRFTLELPEAR